jgi:glycosyltransferase involved in cell wall biosynthesis
MSCGLPVVTSDAGALPELVAHGEGGFTCSPERAGDVASRLLELLDSAALRRRFGAFNRERIERGYRWPRASRRVREIYDEVIAEWKRGLRAR